MRVLEALGALRKAELQFKITWGPTDGGILTVIEQDPSAGAEVDPGTAVEITIGLPAFLFGGAEVQPLPVEPPASGEGSSGAEVQPLPVEPPGSAEGSSGASEASTPTP